MQHTHNGCKGQSIKYGYKIHPEETIRNEIMVVPICTTSLREDSGIPFCCERMIFIAKIIRFFCQATTRKESGEYRVPLKRARAWLMGVINYHRILPLLMRYEEKVMIHIQCKAAPLGRILQRSIRRDFRCFTNWIWICIKTYTNVYPQ